MNTLTETLDDIEIKALQSAYWGTQIAIVMVPKAVAKDILGTGKTKIR